MNRRTPPRSRPRTKTAAYRPLTAGTRRRAPGQAERSDGAYARLRDLIVTGLLPPGSPLIEADLAARLGISRTPVRSALQRLEQEGLVLRRAAGDGEPAAGNGRAMVAPLTADDLREIFVMVGALEATAARQVAGLEPGPRDGLVRTLEEANGGLRPAVTRRPPDLIMAHDRHATFHRVVGAAAAGPRLRSEIEALAPQAERYQRMYAATTMYAVDEFVAAHAIVIAAIRAGDADAAEAAVAADWRLTAERHCEMVAILGERGNW